MITSVEVPPGSRLLISRPRVVVRLDEEVRINGDVNYSIVRFVDGSMVVVALTLHQVAIRLPELMRVHKRHLVNPKYVQALRTTIVAEKEAGVMILTTGEVLPIARRRKRQVRIDFRAYKHATKNNQ